MNLEKALKEYSIEIAGKGYSKVTVKTHIWNINQFIKFYGNKDVEDVTKSDIKAYIGYQLERIKPITLNQHLMNLRTMFKFLVEEELLDRDPMKGIKLLKESKNIIKTYSVDDVKTLLNSFKGKDYLTVRNKTIIMMLCETGIRNSELCGVTLEDVSEDAIRIVGKGNRVRYVPISLPLKRQLLRYMRSREKYMQEGVSHLFVTRTRRPLTRHVMIQTINKLGDDIGLDLKATVHHFRRYYAQQMLKNVDLYTVSRLLGHSDIKTTQIYIQGIEDKDILARGMNSPLSNQ